jgi:very-short-patch-repair endonuclease
MPTKPGGSRADRRETAIRNTDRLIAGLASKQRGVVSRAQLIAAGIHTDAIKLRARSGRLHPVHRGVYLVGHSKPMHGAREMAAVLACGPGAVASHVSAAHLLKLLPYPANPRPVDVTVPGGRDPAKRAGIRIHCVELLDRRDTRRVHSIPITTPARTLLDLATVLPPYLLERTIAEAQVRRLATRRDLLDQLRRNRGRRGTRVLRHVLDLEGGPAFTRSRAERRLLKLVRAADLPTPETNARLHGYEVDFLWRDQRLVVEFDSFRFHSPRARFERDRARDAALAAAGYTVIRVTWRQLVDTPELVVARIAGALALRG